MFRYGKQLLVGIVAVGMVLGAARPACAAPAATGAYLDLLNMHASPASSTDRRFNIFFDEGSWHGYSLPPKGDAD
ncbi:MAG TPA: hypothetical protein VF269_00875, partial [Rhodanobacteraceae bacterium]